MYESEDGEWVRFEDAQAERAHTQKLENKLNLDSQTFEIQCLREGEAIFLIRITELEAEIVALKARLVEHGEFCYGDDEEDCGIGDYNAGEFYK